MSTRTENTTDSNEGIWMQVQGKRFISVSLKRGCIEFKYYADGIHSGLTPPGNNSWPAGLTKAELLPSVCTPPSPSLFAPHQILYRASLMSGQVWCSSVTGVRHFDDSKPHPWGGVGMTLSSSSSSSLICWPGWLLWCINIKQPLPPDHPSPLGPVLAWVEEIGNGQPSPVFHLDIYSIHWVYSL